MKYHTQDFSLKARVQSPGLGWTKGMGPRPKLIFCRNMVMLHIQLKATTDAAS